MKIATSRYLTVWIPCYVFEHISGGYKNPVINIHLSPCHVFIGKWNVTCACLLSLWLFSVQSHTTAVTVIIEGREAFPCCRTAGECPEGLWGAYVLYIYTFVLATLSSWWLIIVQLWSSLCFMDSGQYLFGLVTLGCSADWC